MKSLYSLTLFSLIAFLSACAVVQTGGDVAQGRQALFEGNNQAALSDFQSAAQTDPNYVYGTELREGVLSYLGSAQYLTGTTRQRARLWNGFSPSTGAIMWPGYISALPRFALETARRG